MTPGYSQIIAYLKAHKNDGTAWEMARTLGVSFHSTEDVLAEMQAKGYLLVTPATAATPAHYRLVPALLVVWNPERGTFQTET